MRKWTERWNGMPAAWSLAVAMILASASALWADEPKCKCQTETAAQESYLPLLTRLPLVRHFFHVSPPACTGPCCAEEIDHLVINGKLPEHAKHFGAFFDATGGPPMKGVVIVKRFDVQQCAGNECAAGCAAAETKQCAGGVCELTIQTAAPKKCSCENCQCKNCGCLDTAATHPVATSKHVTAGCTCQPAASERVHHLMEKVAALSIGNAELEAVLATREEVLEAKTEMFESLAGLMMEKAKLEAKLELVAEQKEAARHVQELATENARLKAQLELASHREETTRQTLQLAMENERLKVRLADLERHATTNRVIVPAPPVR